MRLKDKRILVTGSTTGIGKSIAQRFVQEGAQVMIHGLEENLARETSAALGGAPYHVSDLSDPEVPLRLVNASIQELGGLDGLVNNAGVVTRRQPAEMSLETWDWTYAINVRAPFFLIQAALEELSRNKGRILNIGSVNAHGGLSLIHI